MHSNPIRSEEGRMDEEKSLVSFLLLIIELTFEKEGRGCMFFSWDEKGDGES